MMHRRPFSGVAIVALAIVVMCGCSRSKQAATAPSSTASSSPPAAVAASASPAQGDAENGRRVFAENCSMCHGSTGAEGGVGPSLRGENERKNYDATIAWIKNPQPPMPKLYPSPLSEKAVDDVAAYVQKL
jgi:mono/diheme cytochrome c family protein